MLHTAKGEKARSEVQYLCMGNDSNNFTVLLHLFKVLLNAFLSLLIRPPLAGLSESLLFALVP